MEQFVTIVRGKADARELWTLLESKQHFTCWVKRIIAKYKLKSGSGYRKEGREYWIKRDVAAQVGMMSCTPAGKQIRRYYAGCDVVPDPVVPAKLLPSHKKLISEMKGVLKEAKRDRVAAGLRELPRRR